MRVWTAAFVLAGLLALPVSSGAVGKITVDPNAGVRVVESEPVNFWEGDARLSVKVTCSFARKPVRVILAELTNQTGVKLNAGYNTQDWQVRDRKMNAFAKDVPLKDLMQSIARMMKFKWSRSEDVSPCTYRLFMDRKTLLGVESEQLRKEEQNYRKRADLLKKVLADYAGVADLSPTELENLRRTNPMLYCDAKTGVAQAYSEFLKKTPFIEQALLDGRDLNININDLPKESQDALVLAMEKSWTVEARRSPQMSETPPDDFAEQIRSLPLQVMGLTRKNERGGLGAIMVMHPLDPLAMGFGDPASAAGRAEAEMNIEWLESGKPYEEIYREKESLREAARTSDKERYKEERGEPIIEHEADPDLEKKIQIKPKRWFLDLVQRELSEKSGFAVVSDDFSFPDVDALSGEVAVSSVLKAIQDSCNYNWFKHGTVIEFRDREWFKKRSYQIPDAWLDRWARELEKTGTLDIDDLAEMAKLTPEQFGWNVIGDERLMLALFRLPEKRDILRFYGSLTKEQKLLLFAQTGLSCDLLNPQQQELARNAMLERNAMYLQLKPTEITFFGRRDGFEAERGPDYRGCEIKAVATGELKPIEWSVNMPHYQPFERDKALEDEK